MHMLFCSGAPFPLKVICPTNIRGCECELCLQSTQRNHEASEDGTLKHLPPPSWYSEFKPGNTWACFTMGVTEQRKYFMLQYMVSSWWGLCLYCITSTHIHSLYVHKVAHPQEGCKSFAGEQTWNELSGAVVVTLHVFTLIVTQICFE